MNIYIKNTIILLLLLAVVKADAQQNNVLTHYTLNPYLYNAAKVGEDGYTTLSAHYRKQWVNMPKSPDNKLVSAQGLVKNKYGIGAKVYYDQVDIVKNFGALFSYAYYLRFKQPTKHYLSIGLSAGFKSQRISFDESTIKDRYDPSIIYEGESSTVFDAEVGLNYRWKGLQLGVSASNIIPHAYKYANNISELNYSQAFHLYGSAAYDIPVNESITLKPSFMVRYIPNIPVQFDANLLADWKKTVWLGTGYRYNNTALYALAGFRVHDMVSVSYSYEQSINGYQVALGATHEITVAFRFKGKGDDRELMKKINKKLGTLKEELIEDNQEVIDSVKDDLEAKIADLNNKATEEENKKIEESKTSSSSSKVTFSAVGRVNYFLNSATLHEQQNTEAEAIYSKIKGNEDKIIQIIIEGNASIEGSETYNLILSNKRTLSMKNFLIKKGIDADRIVTSFNGNSDALLRYSDDKKNSKPDPNDRYVKVYMLLND